MKPSPSFQSQPTRLALHHTVQLRARLILAALRRLAVGVCAPE
jgi:hypothetical protein